jgi:hypothetical protein
MKNERRPQLGVFGRYIIFSGAGMACLAATTFFFESLARLTGERALPYVILVIVGSVILATVILFDAVPRRLIIPVGICGWIAAFLLLLGHGML